MAKKNVQIIFDRNKTLTTKGKGLVEIRIYLGGNVRKYIRVAEVTKAGWNNYKNSKDLALQVERYEEVVRAMKLMGEDMTVENFNYHIGEEKEKRESNDPQKRSFIEYIRDEIKKEDLREGTYRHKIHVLETLEAYGKLKTFADLTPKNIKAFDKWLHDTGDRTNVTIWDYHKRVKKYTRQLWLEELIPEDPYKRCKFNRGHSKVRTPLNDEELEALRTVELNDALGRVRDLFVFAAYTGLAYVDVNGFDFKRMAIKKEGKYFIDSTRTKTGTKYYTPILKYAMEILEKYDFKLPTISNQKANAYLHVIEQICDFHKSLTFHLARHSFATMCLSRDVPIENVARMLGHTDIKTTQIYAKILNSTIERHAFNLDNLI